jgi:hypothetical protein
MLNKYKTSFEVPFAINPHGRFCEELALLRKEE